MAVVVPIVSTFDNKGIRGAMREFDRAKTGMDKFSAASKLAGLAMVAAGTAAAGFAIKLGVEGVKAALDDQAALAKLNTTLSNMGFAAQSGEVSTWIDSLQRSSAVSEDQLRPAMERLVIATGDVTKAQGSLKLALDIAAGTGKSVEAVANALGKAYEGNYTALGKLGTGIDKATLKSGDLRAITQELSTTFSGQASTAAGTLQGSIRKVEIAAGELLEAFGTGFLNGISDVTDSSNDLADAMRDLEPLMQDLGTASGDLLTDLTRLAGGAYKAATQPDWPTFTDHVANTAIALENFRWVSNGLPGVLGTAADAVISYGAAWGYANRQAAAAPAATADALDKAIASGQVPWQSKLAFIDYTPPDIRRDTKKIRDGINTVANGAADEVEKNIPKLKKSLEQYGRQIVDAFGYGVDSGANPLLASVDKLMGTVVARAKKWGADKTWVSDLQSTFESAKQTISEQLDGAKEALADAETQVKDWAKSTSDALVSAFDISGTFEAAIGEDGKVIASKWQQGVQAKLDEFQWYTNVLNAIKSQGGNDQLIQYLIQQGIAQGGAQGQAMLEQGLIPTFNKYFTDIQKMADDTGLALVPTWMNNGVRDAQATYDGMKKALGAGGPVYDAIMNLMTNLANAMNRTATITVRTVYEGGSSNFTVPGVNKVNASTAPTVTASAPITVNVQGAIDPVGTARQIRRILDRADMRVGTGI